MERSLIYVGLENIYLYFRLQNTSRNICQLINVFQRNGMQNLFVCL